MKNVFALFLDTLTGNVFSYAAESRGQAGPALLVYIQRYGKPNKSIHDNAQEFMHGKFNEICTTQGIQQVRSLPYDPNKNPVEHYMDILTCMMRSFLLISGLDPENVWEDALTQATHIQIRTALQGRCTLYELTFGRRPDVTNLRIFGCEALAYVEKGKGQNYNQKWKEQLLADFRQHRQGKTLWDCTSKMMANNGPSLKSASTKSIQSCTIKTRTQGKKNNLQ